MGYLANKLGDANNLGFFATPEALEAAYPIGAPGYFAIVGSTDTLWIWDGAAWVDSGAPGANAFVYIAYASDDTGTDFTNTFNPALDYIAIKSTTVQIPSPVVGDFVGLWKNYKGAPGTGTGDFMANGTVPMTGDFNANGNNILSPNTIKLDTTPTVGTFEEGKIFYDATNKTVSAMIDSDVTLQIGQEDLVLVYNNTVAPIPNGQIVYVTGAVGDRPTVALALADDYATSQNLGMTTQVIPINGSGFITVRGIVHDFDTSAFTPGVTLYLSDTVPGGLTETDPGIANTLSISAKVGFTLLSHATTGSVYVRQVLNNRLTDLEGVTIATPTVNQTLQWNGSEWINGAAATTSAGVGVTFYLDDVEILPPGAGPETIPVRTLLKVPSTAGEVTDSVQTNGAATYPVLLGRYLYDAELGGTQIDAGVWTFNTYSFVDSATGVTSIPKTARLVSVGAGTCTITGVGTSRTATVTGGTPFVVGDANADPTLAGLLRTPNALFQITAFTSDSVVTVETLSTYTNESGVAYSKDKFLFTAPGVEINNTAVGLNISLTVQPAFPIVATDKLEMSYYADTTSAGLRTISLVYGGTLNYSNFVTPLVVRHNDLAGLQGGSTTERYHITLAEATVVSNTSGTNTGDNATNSTSNAYADGKVEDAIVDGVTTKAPSQNAVFDALAGKQAAGTYLTSANIEDSINDGTTDKAPSENAVFDALALKLDLAGGTMTGALEAADHGTGTTDQVINVSYGTSATAPTASTTTEGSIYITYTA